jgi:menaquinol-cytochrome c reductase cytochrome b/c subunit
MSHHHDHEKVVYVGDSRVRKVQRTNVPKDYSAYPGKTEAFIPNFLLKEWMVGAVVLVGFMVLVISHPSPLGYPADPTNTSFIPMPDWYFLFLYQFLKYDYVTQSLIMFGTVLVPGIAFGGLLLAPWLDRGKERRWYKRPVASGIMLLTLVSMIYLTYIAWTHYEETLKEQGITPEHIERARLIEEGKIDPGAPNIPKPEVPLVATDEPGYEILLDSSCITCHGTDIAGTQIAPSLRGIGDKLTADEIYDIIVKGTPNGGMPPQVAMNPNLSEDDLRVLAEWLAKQKAPAE